MRPQMKEFEAAMYGKAGYYPEYLQHLRRQVENVSRIGIEWAIDRLCSFSVRRINFEEIAQSDASNENWRQILSVYHKLLSRGVPTYPTLQVEKFLLDSVSNIIPTRELDDHQNIVFRDNLPDSLKETWLRVLAQAHVVVDHRCKTSAETESVEEKKFLEDLSQELGPSVFQLFESQRPFSTLVSAPAAESFYDQRVDFSLETKGTKLIVEIDGKQHEESKQRLLDDRRDQLLQRNKWQIIRIPASDVRQKLTNDKLLRIKERFLNDRFLAAATRNFTQPLDVHDAGKAALQLVLTPFAVARVQWAIVQAFLSGHLNIKQPTLKIGIIEEDIPCAFVAVWDLIRSVRYLWSLARVRGNLPKISLHVFRTSDLGLDDGIGRLEVDPGVETVVLTRNELERLSNEHFDLVVSVSMFHTGLADFQHNVGQNKCTVVSSVHSPRGMVQIASAHPVKYRLGNEPSESLLFLLQWIFRKRNFLDGQFEMLRRTLTLEDMIGLLPTGGRKSLCYQLSALLQPGTTIVVDPIISLMLDQVDNLRRMQIHVAGMMSSDQSKEDRNEAMEGLAQRRFLLLFVSPERLQIPAFRDALKSLCLTTPVPYLAIDEAHCISEWGHDFRPSYLKLADNVRRICVFGDFRPSIIAVTGTASSVGLSDIQRLIGVGDEGIVTPGTFDRPELELEVSKCESGQKWLRLEGLMRELPQRFKMPARQFYQPDKGGIVFCPHVGGDFGIVHVKDRMRTELRDLIPDVRMYSGKPPKNYDSSEWKRDKRVNQKDFKENKVPVIVATKAFGMGIDKPNIRYTIHYGMPTSLEAFYQEVGRAGRDKSKAICTLLFSSHPENWAKLFDLDVSAEEIARQVEAISWKLQDDITRMLYFHTGSWRGVQNEFDRIILLVRSIIDQAIAELHSDESITVRIPFEGYPIADQDEDSRTDTEKVLYRLSILGIVSDYALDHNARVFEVEVVRRNDDFFKSALLDYVGRYKPAEYKEKFVDRIEKAPGSTMLEKCLMVLLEFVYEEIEKKRRRAILQIAEVASTSLDNKAFRRALLNYLETSEFTKKLTAVSTEMVPSEWIDIASNVEDLNSAQRLLGGCRRALESYPDHPGLLILSWYARLITSDGMAVDELERAVKALVKAPLEENIREDTLAKIMKLVASERPSVMPTLCYVSLQQLPQAGIARIALGYVEISSDAGKLATKVILACVLEKVKLVTTHIVGGESP